MASIDEAGSAQPQADNSPSALYAKRLATAKARAALWGGTLTAIEGDNGKPLYVVSRWALCKSFEWLSEVERFLERAEGLRS